jgi:hypothetical protein
MHFDLVSGSVFMISIKNNRAREASVVISPQWTMLEEIEFHRLAKLRLEVDEPEELYVPFEENVMQKLINKLEILMVDFLPMRSPTTV